MSNPQKLKRVVIKEELVALTGGWLSALVLNQFLYWSERTSDADKYIRDEKNRLQGDLDIELTHGWIYKSGKELSKEIMGCASGAAARRHAKKLVERGWLDERHNPKHRWDRTMQYRPNIVKIQRDLLDLGYHLDDYPLPPQNDLPSNAESTPLNGKFNRIPPSVQAIPETNTNITPQTIKDHGADAPPPDDTSLSVQEKELEPDADEAPVTPLVAKGKRTRKRSARDERMDGLVKVFCELTSLPPPELNTEKQKRAAGALWYAPLTAMAKICDNDVERTGRLMKFVVTEMDGDGLTISSPNSIRKTAIAEQARRKRNGRHENIVEARCTNGRRATGDVQFSQFSATTPEVRERVFATLANCGSGRK